MTAARFLRALVPLCLAARAAAQQAAPAPAAYPNQPFVIEQFYQRTRFENDGTGRTELRARIRVQSEAALQAFGQLEFPYNSAYQRLDVDYVRVLKPGGDTIVAPATAVLDMTGEVARQAPTFSDIRVKEVTVPGLRPGDVLEYQFTWTNQTALAPGEFWASENFLDAAIVLDQRLTLDVPRQKFVQVRTTGVAEPVVSDSGDRRVYEWRHSNSQLDTTTAGQARREARARHAPAAVQVTTFRSWEEVGRWYAGLERDRETLSPAIRAKADSLVRGRSSLLDSIAALYDYVSQEFRYVSVSFGIGRFQPHTAAEVLADEYGDCKDKHVLLATLLRAVGVPSAPALVSTDKDIDPTVPSPGQFDHVITYVPAGRDTLWLDATPGSAPFRLLLFNLRGQNALVMPLDGMPRLLRTPAVPPFALFDSVTADGAIDPSGKLSATYRYVLRGESETAARLVFRQLSADQLGYFAGELARRSGLAGTTSQMQGSDPKATHDPFRFSFALSHPDAVSWTGSRASYQPPLPEQALPEADSAAVADTVFLAPSTGFERLTLRLPPGFTPQVPLAVTLTRDFGTYRSTYRLRGDTITVERALAFLVRGVPPDRVRDYLAFRRAVRDDEASTVTLVRSLAAGSGAGDVDAIHRAGWDALQRGDAQTAIEMFRQVVRQRPDDHYDWNNLGRAFLQLSQLDSAAHAFRRAIAVNPQDPYAFNNLGLAEWRLHHDDSAAASFRRQIAVSPLDRYAHSNLGQLAIEMHQDSVAVAELTQAAAITPNDAPVHINLGRAYLAAGRAAEGFAELQRALAIQPTAQTLNSAAYALAQVGQQLDTAERYVRLAIDSTEQPLRSATLDDGGPRAMVAALMLAPYWDTLGWVLFQRGDLAGAERFLRAAWLTNSGDGEIGDHLGQVYERLGRRADAIRTYALAMKTMRTVPETPGRLARLVGGQARAAREADAAGQNGFQDLRTIRLPQLTRASVAGEVQVLLGPGPTIADVRVSEGTPGLHAPADRLRGAAAAFDGILPDTAAIRLPLRGLLSCSPAAGCTFIMLDRGQVRNIVVSRPVPGPP